MHIIAVDDEPPALWMLKQAIVKAVQYADIKCFESSEEALLYSSENMIDIAFLDIDMDGMNGLVLAKKLKDIYDKTNIIFVTGFSNFMGDAFDMHASGYVLKPIDPERVKLEIENLRNPLILPKGRVQIRCFGNFDIWVDGKPLVFGRPKSKEILAYLVDRQGACISKKELVVVLWEDKDYTRSIQSHLHILLSDMMRTLKEGGADNIILKQRSSYALDTSKFYCDYYSYIKGDISAVNSYHGEYMTNYSWAEFTVGLLTSRIQNNS